MPSIVLWIAGILLFQVVFGFVIGSRFRERSKGGTR